jgi:hypothetical protein
VVFDVPLEMEAMFNVSYPKALERVKALAEKIEIVRNAFWNKNTYAMVLFLNETKAFSPKQGQTDTISRYFCDTIFYNFIISSED